MKATSRALDHLLCAVGDPLADLDGIDLDHPEFDRGQTIRAAVGVLAKSPDALPALLNVLNAGAGPGASPRTRAHLAAAQAWLDGDPVLAAERYAAILESWPRDLLALRLVQSCNFFLGRHERACAVFERSMPSWTKDDPGYPSLIAMASFAYAESGNAARAEALGREALSHDASCPMAVHAVAHALAESGRAQSGAQWMREQRVQWLTDSRMCTHNAWHLAMFDVDAGNVGPALGILDQWLLPGGDKSPVEACDATGLLWRLTEKGVPDGGRWRRLSDAFERTLTPGFWSFVDLHAAVAHFAAGQQARLLRLVDALGRCAERDDFAGRRARSVTLPGLHALLAGEHPSLAGAGGSRVQLELFARFGRGSAHVHREGDGLDRRGIRHGGTAVLEAQLLLPGAARPEEPDAGPARSGDVRGLRVDRAAQAGQRSGRVGG
jgi:hypothetical protein